MIDKNIDKVDQECLKAGMELFNALVGIAEKYDDGRVAQGALNVVVLYLFKSMGEKEGREALQKMHAQQLELFDAYDIQTIQQDA